MTLEKIEIEEMHNIMSSYRNLDSKLSQILDNLKDLEKEKDTILESIEDAKNKEKSFFYSLEQKYGEGFLDIENLTFITKNKK